MKANGVEGPCVWSISKLSVLLVEKVLTPEERVVFYTNQAKHFKNRRRASTIAGYPFGPEEERQELLATV